MRRIVTTQPYAANADSPSSSSGLV